MERFDNSFYKWEKELANQPFLRQPFGDKWEEYTWKEAGQMARRLATGLKSMGLPEKAHIGLVSKNCREWIIADLAIMMAGYVSVPFFANLNGEELGQVLKLGDVNALFVGKVENWENMKTGVPAGMPLIAFPHYEGNGKVESAIQWQDFIDQHEPMQEEYHAAMDDVWTIIFTSGTTGTPKGVVLDYRTLNSTRKSTEEGENPLCISFEGNNRFFSYLPLNHIAERLVVEMGCLRYGGTMSFVESMDTFAQNLQSVKPTVFFSVPRLYTKFRMAILAKMPQEKLDRFLRIPILKNIIKKKIRTSLGLQEARQIVSGAAVLPDSLFEFYQKLGIDIMNGYGMTENCAICTYMLGKDYRPGSVGKAQVGAEVKIDPDTNEILMTGPYVMTEYYKDTEKTKETIIDGWLRTGDEGRMDKDGYLYITGRVKDTFKTAKGEFVTPVPLEVAFEASEDVEQICVTGHALPQPIALAVLSDIGKAKSKEVIENELVNILKNTNTDIASYKKISTAVVVKDAWTPENGLLTPTLKVKRSKVYDRYKDQLLALHEDAKEVVWE